MAKTNVIQGSIRIGIPDGPKKPMGTQPIEFGRRDRNRTLYI